MSWMMSEKMGRKVSLSDAARIAVLLVKQHDAGDLLEAAITAGVDI